MKAYVYTPVPPDGVMVGAGLGTVPIDTVPEEGPASLSDPPVVVVEPGTGENIEEH